MKCNTWTSTTIGEQLVLQRGYDISKAEQVEGKVPVISSGGIKSFHNQSKVKGPGVLLGRKGTIGTVYYTESDYWPHSTTLYVKDFRNNNPRFVYYFFQSIKEQLKNMDVGTSNPTLNRNHVHPMNVMWPCVEIQNAIESILSTLDAKIELNSKITSNLQQQAQAIFKSWFVDFEPYGGYCPTNWETVCFADFLDVRSEKSNDSDIPLYSVTDRGIMPRGEKFKKNLSKSTTKNKVIYQTDLVFGMSREILNWGIMRQPKGCVSSAYHVYQVSERINSFYLESYIRANQSYFRDLIKPAAREGQSVDKAALMKKELLLPPEEELKKYYEVENTLTSMMFACMSENERLSKIRDLLIPKLISGEIDVSELAI